MKLKDEHANEYSAIAEGMAKENIGHRPSTGPEDTRLPVADSGTKD
jgi:hypothetical protein